MATASRGRRAAGLARWRGGAVVAVSAALAACGGPPGGQGNSAPGGQGFSQAFGAAFEKSFNESFGKSLHASCLSSSQRQGAAADLAERYCSCLVAQLAPLSVKEKQSLSPSSPTFTQAGAACKAQVQP
jgi:hypothetical protein